MANTKKRTVAAVQDWKQRMATAKQTLKGVGMQAVLEGVVLVDPTLDSLTLATRWRNAWYVKVSDPEITQAVEKVAAAHLAKQQQSRDRLKRQKLST